MPTIPPLNPLLGSVSTPTHAAKPVGAAKQSAEAFRQFEALIMQTFVESMLPKNAESVFGKGTAGGIWKSMLAEHLAGEIARSGRLGLAQQLAAGAASRAAAIPAQTVSEPGSALPQPVVGATASDPGDRS